MDISQHELLHIDIAHQCLDCTILGVVKRDVRNKLVFWTNSLKTKYHTNPRQDLFLFRILGYFKAVFFLIVLLPDESLKKIITFTTYHVWCDLSVLLNQGVELELVSAIFTLPSLTMPARTGKTEGKQQSRWLSVTRSFFSASHTVCLVLSPLQPARVEAKIRNYFSAMFTFLVFAHRKKNK